ncbi:sigma-70 family RNA polymerase sigma factor [Pedococcus bigeumensis]|uniref:RNA polymerase sigma factor n=1 Tax=Pedococcus bigeumensis TaxID=433644 RepID=UPI002FE9FAD2
MDDLDEPTPDAALLDRLRAGDREAAVDLWTRHYPSVLLAARRVTRQPRDAEEIASDAFSGMLSALSGGAGPTTSVRAYLVTSVRNLAASRATRSSAGDVMTDDVALFDKPTADTTAHMSELQLVRVAFAELPQRWQIVLWRTAVDKDSNIEVGRAMGLSPNGVAALAKRARRGFRLSYLRAHLSDRGVEAQCKPFIDGLADFSISEPDAPSALTAHVASCVACTHRIDELRAVNLHFAGVLGPAIVGLFPSKMLLGAAGVSAAGGAGAAGGGAGGAGGGAGGLLGGPGPTTNLLGFRPGARWALGSAAMAGAAVAILFATRPEVITPPPVAQTLPSSAQPSASPSPTTRPPTVPRRTAPPRTSTAAPTTPMRSTTAPAPSPAAVARPSSAAATPSSAAATPTTTTAAPRTSPLAVDLEITGPRSGTSIQVSAAAEGIVGPLRLVLELPDGVSLAGSEGAWDPCTQSQNVVTCTARAAADGRWSGTIHTAWAADSQGRVRATVSGTYSNGSPATGSVGTTWPP